MDKKTYTDEGFLIVAETDSCPFWEKDLIPCDTIRNKDCFFCKHADFRTQEFRRKAEETPKTGKLYSFCKNEKNADENQSFQMVNPCAIP